MFWGKKGDQWPSFGTWSLESVYRIYIYGNDVYIGYPTLYMGICAHVWGCALTQTETKSDISGWISIWNCAKALRHQTSSAELV